MRACSVEIRAAPAWSSQKPGAPIASSSSSRRRARRSGSKVITDPGELGPDLLEALIEALRRLGHAPRVAAPPEGARSPGLTEPMGVTFTCANTTGRSVSTHRALASRRRLSPAWVTVAIVSGALAAWLVTFARMDDMDAGPGTDLGSLA